MLATDCTATPLCHNSCGHTIVFWLCTLPTILCCIEKSALGVVSVYDQVRTAGCLWIHFCFSTTEMHVLTCRQVAATGARAAGAHLTARSSNSHSGGHGQADTPTPSPGQHGSPKPARGMSHRHALQDVTTLLDPASLLQGCSVLKRLGSVSLLQECQKGRMHGPMHGHALADPVQWSDLSEHTLASCQPKVLCCNSCV